MDEWTSRHTTAYSSGASIHVNVKSFLHFHNRGGRVSLATEFEYGQEKLFVIEEAFP